MFFFKQKKKKKKELKQKLGVNRKAEIKTITRNMGYIKKIILKGQSMYALLHKWSFKSLGRIPKCAQTAPSTTQNKLNDPYKQLPSPLLKICALKDYHKNICLH